MALTQVQTGMIADSAVTTAKLSTDLQASTYGFKNRIINGAMMIDQRNAGAAVAAPNSNTYQLDRWCCNVGGAGFTIQQNAGSVTPPAGFKNYYGVTSTSTTTASNYSARQFIEGFNSADLMYGTSSAKTTTLSFWVYSSLTGTFGGAIQNASGNRSYVYSYTINAANTWQYVTVTIPGDTGGTWVGATNGAGIVVYISYSAAAGQIGGTGAWTGNDYRAPTGQVNLLGTNGATWYITGVQFEVGSTATSFDYRPYGTELALCQRYYLRFQGGTGYLSTALCNAVNTAFGTFCFPVEMRTNPTSVETSSTASHYAIAYLNSAVSCTSVPTFGTAGTKNAGISFASTSVTLTLGQSALLNVGPSGYLGYSAEL